VTSLQRSLPPEDAKSRLTDFSEVEHRLEIARAALENVWTPSTEETQRILQTRAHLLTQHASRREDTENTIDALEFTLAYERYAIETRYVYQVAMLEQLIPLPCTPDYVVGIVNMRGVVLPVFNLKNLFELPVKGLTDLNKIIVLQSEKIRFGILADEIVGARNIRLSDVQSSLPTLTGVRKDYLMGVTPERVTLLDAEKLLTSENIVVHEQVAE
jgi:purine-binding chemotaxis protein CheW